MTMTESAPTTARVDERPLPDGDAGGMAGILGSGHHVVVGRTWIVASALGLVAAGVAGVAVSAERLDTASIDVVDTDWFAQLYAFHPIVGVFLFLLPLTIGVASVVVPPQLGARTLAFPRAMAFAAWVHLLGAAVMVAGYLSDGGPFGDDADGVELYLVGLVVVVVAQMAAWISLGTTVLAMRRAGMRLTRVPLFSWSVLVSSLVWLLTLPVLAGVTVVVFVAYRYGVDLLGAADGAYDWVAWVFGQPAVYALGIVVLGVVGDVVPVFSSTRHRRHKVAMGLIGAYGVLSMGAWALPGIEGDLVPFRYEAPWVAVSFVILVPVLGLLGLWADTARHGRLRLSSPLLYGMGAATMLATGVVAGAIGAIEPIKTVVDGEGTTLAVTTWSSGVSHYVVMAATIALLGAVTFWAPRILGGILAEGASRALAGLVLVGTVLLALSDLVSGLLGQGSRLTGVADNVDAVEAFNLVSLVGGALVGLSLLGWLLLVMRAAASGGESPADPWGGHTLEWASDPDVEVGSEAPLYDARHRVEVQ